MSKTLLKRSRFINVPFLGLKQRFTDESKQYAEMWISVAPFHGVNGELSVTTGNTNAPTIMIAEKAVDLIKATGRVSRQIPSAIAN